MHVKCLSDLDRVIVTEPKEPIRIENLGAVFQTASCNINVFIEDTFDDLTEEF